MSINDYNSLAQQVQLYLNRNDPATLSQIGQFIAVGEQNVYRDLRVPTMEARIKVTVGYDDNAEVSYNSFAVPNNYLETRLVSIPDQSIVCRPTDTAGFVRRQSRIAGFPEVYTREANSFVFNRIPASLIEVDFHYYRTFANIAPDNEVNAEDPRPLLTVCSDAFLYGALAEASTYLGDDRLEYFLNRYNGAIQSLQKSADDLELSGAPLQVSISSDDYYGEEPNWMR